MTAELLLVGFATRDRARDQPAHSWRVGGLDIRPLCSADPWVRWAKVHGIEVLLRGTEEDDRRSGLFELGADDSPSQSTVTWPSISTVGGATSIVRRSAWRYRQSTPGDPTSSTPGWPGEELAWARFFVKVDSINQQL